MTKQVLSPFMANALKFIADNGGLIERYQGGFWNRPGLKGQDILSGYYGTNTINALVARGELVYVKWIDGRNGKFPVAAAIPEEKY